VSECAKSVIKWNVPLTNRQMVRKQLESIVSQENIVEEEAKHSTERWIFNRLAASGTISPHRSTCSIMQAAKKLVLVDEFDREYKRLQKPADALAKTNKSLQLSNKLHNQSLPDDRKGREYIAALHKYLNIRKKVPVEPEVKPNPLTLPPPPPAPVRTRRRRKTQVWEPY